MKKLLAILLLTATSVFGQIVFTEDFVAGYDTNWTRTYPGGFSDKFDTVTVARSSSDGSDNMSLRFDGGSIQVDYGSFQYYVDSLSTTDSDFDVRGYLWKTGSLAGANAGMIGIWNATTKWVGICVDDVYTDQNVTLKIRNGGVSGTFQYDFDATPPAVVAQDTNYYRVTYSSSTDSIRFYIWTDTEWLQLGTTQYQDFGTIQWKVGAFGGQHNINIYDGLVFYDSLWVSFTPSNWITVTLNYPTDAGIVINAGDTLDVHWDGDSTVMAPYKLYFSSDNGVTYALVDTTSDSTYSWIAPNLNALQCKFLVTSSDSSYEDDSDNAFLLLPYSTLNIIYPIEKTGVTITVGDTLHINTESLFVNEIWLYWSNDSTNWSFIDSVAVDTVNSQYMDTTSYVWAFDGTESGPEVWIKVEEQADTNLYVFSEAYISVGDAFPLGMLICQTNNGIGFIEQMMLYDPSCGWSSVTHRYYTGTLDDLGESRTWTYNACPWPWTNPSCAYARSAPVYLTATDTTEQLMDVFYGAPASTVTYRNRLYFVDNDTLRCNDLVNDIDSIFVSDLAPLGWITGDELLQVYHVQRSKISGEYLPADTTFENLNDVGFKPKILISEGVHPYEVAVIEALGYPNDAHPADDIQKILTGSLFHRFFFRGIHPKIDKDR